MGRNYWVVFCGVHIVVVVSKSDECSKDTLREEMDDSDFYLFCYLLSLFIF